MYKILLTNPEFANDPAYSTELSRTIYNDELMLSDRTVITGSGKNSITEIPTFEFTILPNHPLYSNIRKFTSLITVYRGDTIKFYGRVVNDGSDFYGQKVVSCEGALSFLLDTYIEPFKEKLVAPVTLLGEIITAHNNLIDKQGMVNPEPYKRFTLGNVTVDGNTVGKKLKLESYQQTRGAIDSILINELKGYLFARYENGTLYLDWLKEVNRTNSQPVKMAVNLLDRTIEENADEYYTVMLPIGDNKKTIESVNNGNKHLEDAEAIAKYGRIYKPESISDKKKADEIKAEAEKEFAKRGTHLPISINVKAVDMNLLGAEVDALDIGDKLLDVDSGLENSEQTLTIVENDYDILNPGNDTFVIENQEAIDKRNNSTSGNGTLSGRAGGIDRGLDEDRRNLIKTYDNINLTVNDNYTLTANAINELSQRHNIYTKEFDLEADTINQASISTDIKEISVPTFKNDRDYTPGYYVRRGGHTYRFLSYHTAGDWNEDGEGTEWMLDDSVSDKMYVKAVTGTTLKQNSDGQIINYSQDISGIRLNKVVDPLNDFDRTKAYAKDDEVRYVPNGKAYRFLVDHPANTDWDFAQVTEIDTSNRWHYETVYKYDSHNNYIIDLVTGEAVYDTQDDPDVYKDPPIKNVVNRTKNNLIDVIGTTDTSQWWAETFSDQQHYSIGDYVKYGGKNYRFIADHPAGPWQENHVEPASDTVTIDGQTVYTLTSIHGSTVFRNEKELDNIVGVCELIQSVDQSTGKVTRTFNIKNGAGLSVTENNTRIGIFENGELNAGLMVDSLNARSSDMPGNAFSSTYQYEVGDYCTYNNKVYQCIVRHKGTWNSSNFQEAQGKLVKLKADVVDLGEYATVGTLDAKMVRAYNIFSNVAEHEDIFAGSLIAESEIVAGDGLYGAYGGVNGTWYADSMTINDSLYLGEDGVDMADAIVSIAENQNPPSGKIGFTYTTAGGQTGSVNFNIAGTQFFMDSVGIRGHGAWYWSEDDRTYLSQVTPNYGTDYEYVELPTITVDSVLGTNSYVNMFAYGPGTSSTRQAVSAAKTLYLQQDNTDCYLTNTSSSPDSSNTIAKLTKTGSVVNVVKGSWTTSGNAKKITFSPSSGSGTSASAEISLDADGWEWDDGYARVQNVVEVYDGNASIGLQSYITLPTITASASAATYNTSTHTYSYTGSAKYDTHTLATSSSVTTGTEAYADGWDGCFATKSFSGTASKTLDYGESVSVSASITNSSGSSVSIGSRTFTAPSDNGGVSALGLSSAYDTQPSADEDKGELTANKYYKVTAVPVSGTGKSFSFKTPAGGSGGGGISTVSLSSPSTTDPTATYDGGTVDLDRYYTVTATPVSGESKTLKFKTPAGNAVTIDLNGGSAASYPIRRSSKSGLLSALGTTESAAVEIFQRGSSSNNVDVSNYWHGFRVDAGSSSKYYYFQNKTPAGGSHTLTCSETAARSNDGSGKSAGAISKSGLIARAYIAFTISCGGTNQRFYITVND